MKRKPWESLDKETADPGQWEEFPNIVGCLIHEKKGVCWDDCGTGEGKWIDVRLQVYEDGMWSIHLGPSDYDSDHRGFWGASSISPKTNCKELAKELIEQVFESFCTMGGN